MSEIIPREYLIKQLYKIINKDNNYGDIEFRRKVTNEFIKKKFSTRTPNLVLDGERSLEELNEFQLIAFTIGVGLKAEKYFGKVLLDEYDNYIKIDEKITHISFKNFIKDNDETYYGLITMEQLYKYMEECLFSYSTDIQRQPSYYHLGNKTIKIPTLDTNSINNIKEMILENKFEPSEIVLCLLLKEGKRVNYEIDEVYSNLLVNIDIAESLLIIDGMHRILGMINATSEVLYKENRYIDMNIPIKFIIADKDRALNLVHQSFLRSNVSSEYLKSITVNDTMRFLDKIINNSTILKGNVANTYDECKYLNKITYKTLLIDTINKFDWNLKDKSLQIFTSKKFADIIDIVVSSFKKLYPKNTILDYPNIYCYLFYEAYKLIEANGDESEVIEIVSRLALLDENDIKAMKLGNKNININNILEYMEVL